MSSGALELMLAAFVGLIGLSVAALLLLREQERQTQVQKRLAVATGAAARVRVSEPTTTLVMAAQTQRGLARRLSGLLGFDPAKPDHYPVRWPVVLVAAAPVAYAVVWLAQRVFGEIAFAAVPVLWLFLCRMIFGWCIGRRKNTLFRQFPDALAMIVRSVRVGIPVGEAIRAVAREVPVPTGPEFARLADELAIGVPLDEALHLMAERNDMAEYRFFATALTLQNQTGGGLSETLENLAEVIRKRVALRERGRALASEAKTSAAVLASLPPFSGVALWFINTDYISVLFVDKAGQMVLAAAVLMLGTGIMSMRIIIKKSLQ